MENSIGEDNTESRKRLQHLIRTKRGKRETQSDTELIVKLLNNMNQKQNLLMENQKNIRGKRETKTDNALIVKLLNNINQKQILLMENQKQILQTLDENYLIDKIKSVSDVTSIIAASLVNKNNVPFIPTCQKTVKEGNNDIDTCLQPQIAQLYPYLGVPVRLVGSSNPSEGRVEVYYKGRFTTVCDHGWDRDDARVVCRSLGYTGRVTAFDGPRFSWGHKFGEGEGLIMIYLVNCKGDEDSLLSCKFEEPPESWTCSHGDDAGVQCQEERLKHQGK